MAIETWVLTDVGHGVFVDEISLSGDDLGPAGEGCSISKRTLRGGLSDGVDVVEIDNGLFRFAVAPTRGMGLWKGWIDGWPLGWDSPIRGPVHPKFVPIGESSGLGFLDGVDELLFRCGLVSNGAPDFGDDGRLLYPLHGRIANLPACHVEVAFDTETGELSVTGIVEETRFLFHTLRLTSTVKTRPGEAGLRIADTVTNLSMRAGEMQLLYHINFGRPLAEPGSRLVAPVDSLAPRDARAAEGLDDWQDYGAEEPDFAEQVYFCHLLAGEDSRTEALLKNADSTLGVSLRYDTGQLPCFTLWKNMMDSADGYVTGLEPGVNFPNPRSFEEEKNRVSQLAPGESRQFELGLTVRRGAEEVAAVEEAVAQLQKIRQPTIHRLPQPGWCVV